MTSEQRPPRLVSEALSESLAFAEFSRPSCLGSHFSARLSDLGLSLFSLPHVLPHSSPSPPSPPPPPCPRLCPGSAHKFLPGSHRRWVECHRHLKAGHALVPGVCLPSATHLPYLTYPRSYSQYVSYQLAGNGTTGISKVVSLSESLRMCLYLALPPRAL